MTGILIPPGRRGFLAGLSALALTGCTDPAPRRARLAPVAFTGSPIRLAVARIIIRQAIPADPAAHPLLSQFPVPPVAVAERWADDRLAAAGGPGVARFRVIETSATSTFTGKATLFKPDAQRETIIVRLRLRLEIAPSLDAPAKAMIELTAKAAGAANGAMSLVEREEFLHGLALSLGSEIDAHLPDDIHNRLGPYIA